MPEPLPPARAPLHGRTDAFFPVAHVWEFALERPLSDVERAVLSEEEVTRAGRFAFERDRVRYMRSRFAVRSILGETLNVSPREVPIAIGEHGKPFLDLPDAPPFNLSHSQARGVLAIADGPFSSSDSERTGVGIDIERINPQVDVLAVAGTVFSPGEIAALEDLAGKARIDAFFICWTRKEAYLKALGFGFTRDPREVTVAHQREVAVLARLADQEHPPLAIHTMQRTDEFRVSLAVPLACARIEHHVLEYAD